MYVCSLIKKALQNIENPVITIMNTVLDLDSIRFPFIPVVIRAYYNTANVIKNTGQSISHYPLG